MNEPPLPPDDTDQRGRRQPTAAAPTRQDLVMTHIGLARSLARRFANRGESYQDLVQVASLALVKAAERFDPDRGVQFSTFALACIVGELKRHFRDQGWAVRAPRRLQELYLELGTTIERISQELGRTPTVPELAEALGVSEPSVLEALEAGRGYRTSSLDDPDDDGQTLTEQLGSPDSGYAHVENCSVLSLALNRMQPRDRLILEMRFVDGLTQSEIGARLDISQMQVSRLLAASVQRLRSTVTDRDIADILGV